MATPSPLNWNQRKPKVPSLRFATAEDYARHMTAKTAGPTGMHERETIQTGEHKGKTPSQVVAEYMESSGLPSRTTLPLTMPSLGAMTAPKAPAVADSSSIDPGMVRLPGRGMPLPSLNAPSSLLPTIQPPGSPAPAPVPAASATPMPVAAGSPPPAENLLAQGMSDQAAGITQRGTNGSVLYGNGSSISPTSPTGGRVLTMPNGKRGGSVSPRQAGKTATFDGLTASQFGQQAAARQNTGNAFTGYAVPSKADPFKSAPAAPAVPALIASKPPAPAAPAAPATAPKPAPAAPAPRTPLNGMQIMTPEVARAAVAADKAQNPTPPAATDPGRITTLNGKPYKSPLAADMGLPQPGQPSAPAPVPAPPAAPSTAKPTGAFYAKAYTPGSLKPPMMLAGARAAGGPVQGGQPYLVGEQGPEIVVPDQNGTVIPNHQMPSMRPPVRGSMPRKTARPPASVIPIKPPSLLSTFG